MRQKMLLRTDKSKTLPPFLRSWGIKSNKYIFTIVERFVLKPVRQRLLKYKKYFHFFLRDECRIISLMVRFIAVFKKKILAIMPTYIIMSMVKSFTHSTYV